MSQNIRIILFLILSMGMSAESQEFKSKALRTYEEISGDVCGSKLSVKDRSSDAAELAFKKLCEESNCSPDQVAASWKLFQNSYRMRQCVLFNDLSKNDKQTTQCELNNLNTLGENIIQRNKTTSPLQLIAESTARSIADICEIENTLVEKKALDRKTRFGKYTEIGGNLAAGLGYHYKQKVKDAAAYWPEAAKNFVTGKGWGKGAVAQTMMPDSPAETQTQENMTLFKLRDTHEMAIWRSNEPRMKALIEKYTRGYNDGKGECSQFGTFDSPGTAESKSLKLKRLANQLLKKDASGPDNLTSVIADLKKDASTKIKEINALSVKVGNQSQPVFMCSQLDPDRKGYDYARKAHQSGYTDKFISSNANFNTLYNNSNTLACLNGEFKGADYLDTQSQIYAEAFMEAMMIVPIAGVFGKGLQANRVAEAVKVAAATRNAEYAVTVAYRASQSGQFFARANGVAAAADALYGSKFFVDAINTCMSNKSNKFQLDKCEESNPKMVESTLEQTQCMTNIIMATVGLGMSSAFTPTVLKELRLASKELKTANDALRFAKNFSERTAGREVAALNRQVGAKSAQATKDEAKLLERNKLAGVGSATGESPKFRLATKIDDITNRFSDAYSGNAVLAKQDRGLFKSAYDNMRIGGVKEIDAVEFLDALSQFSPDMRRKVAKLIQGNALEIDDKVKKALTVIRRSGCFIPQK